MNIMTKCRKLAELYTLGLDNPYRSVIMEL